MICETTIRRAVEVEGVGLHHGAPVHLRITPAPAATGIVFVRTDLENTQIPASWEFVERVSYATSLMHPRGIFISTTEHLLSVLYSMGVDNAYIELDNPVTARYVKYEHVYQKATNLAISDIRMFGNSDGKPSKTPLGLTAKRDTDTRNAFISWKPVPGAVGYNILWGIGKNKLYQNYQVWADKGNKLELRALNMGQDYYIAIEAFNETGVSPQSEEQETPDCPGSTGRRWLFPSAYPGCRPPPHRLAPCR